MEQKFLRDEILRISGVNPLPNLSVIGSIHTILRHKFIADIGIPQLSPFLGHFLRRNETIFSTGQFIQLSGNFRLVVIVEIGKKYNFHICLPSAAGYILQIAISHQTASHVPRMPVR